MDLKGFISSVTWRFAKTYPKWPHWYIVRENVDEASFLEFVKIIRKDGYEGKFYNNGEKTEIASLRSQ
jgi:hypothetical protein